MIRHSVVFKLKYAVGSSEEKIFLAEVEKLRLIEGVQNFECLRQISTKNTYDYGIFMQFNNLEAYNTYNKHPEHIAFVQNFWVNYVADFLELDFEKI
ncbi:Dabb family protein [Aurantibacter crassamenti]|uniref:Dabb family protein n=1 Tax=Aurantibacter crassamenti TaxID=1837375 RepID=UPI00193A2FC2|nr:Dabb family protein [Aurantibacter crassamenti]MBM1105796.1 Dabb family protein [Aurantibacter crassamenti]